MKEYRYFIKTFGTDDTQPMTCCYPRQQWEELILRFKKAGIEFEAYRVEVER